MPGGHSLYAFPFNNSAQLLPQIPPSEPTSKSERRHQSHLPLLQVQPRPESHGHWQSRHHFSKSCFLLEGGKSFGIAPRHTQRQHFPLTRFKKTFQDDQCYISQPTYMLWGSMGPRCQQPKGLGPALPTSLLQPYPLFLSYTHQNLHSDWRAKPVIHNKRSRNIWESPGLVKRGPSTFN